MEDLPDRSLCWELSAGNLLGNVGGRVLQSPYGGCATAATLAFPQREAMSVSDSCSFGASHWLARTYARIFWRSVMWRRLMFCANTNLRASASLPVNVS